MVERLRFWLFQKERSDSMVACAVDFTTYAIMG